jgi:hypothetical protein
VLGWPSTVPGDTCYFLVTSTDGRSQSLRLSVVANPSPSHMCCGYPADGHGIWTAVNDRLLSPAAVVVDFSGDGGVQSADGGGTKDALPDGRTTGDTPNPCASCAANEVCVQSFDGVCHSGSVACKPVSDTCRSKLSASRVKNCKSIAECESEFCGSPFRCVYDSPCGTEAPTAALYCYGP